MNKDNELQALECLKCGAGLPLSLKCSYCGTQHTRFHDDALPIIVHGHRHRLYIRGSSGLDSGSLRLIGRDYISGSYYRVTVLDTETNMRSTEIISSEETPVFVREDW